MAFKNNPVLQVVVKPETGNNTRLQYYNEKKDGRPDMQPTENPKITRAKKEKLRVSGSKKISKADKGDGIIFGAKKNRKYYYVTNDPYNKDAAKKYVKEGEVEFLYWGEIYTVKSGDNLTKIAEKYFTSDIKFHVDRIYEANLDVIGKDKDLIHPNQTLLIPYDGLQSGTSFRTG